MQPLLPGCTYHIYNQANSSDNIFREVKNYPLFLQKYEKHIAPIAETFAWCLMPYHFHLLLKIHNENTLLNKFPNLQGFKNLEGLEQLINRFIAKQSPNLFNSYSKSINKVYSRRGSLFNPRFKRKLISSDDQFRDTFLYIHLNPVKHGFTDHEHNWPHSSFHIYASCLSDSFINLNHSIQMFGNYRNLLYCMNKKRNKILSLKEEFY
ncbi:MAG: transposase [Bacteroidia bacterium]|nr:transposase [Bacteroidia bacterium]